MVCFEFLCSSPATSLLLVVLNAMPAAIAPSPLAPLQAGVRTGGSPQHGWLTAVIVKPTMGVEEKRCTTRQAMCVERVAFLPAPPNVGLSSEDASLPYLR